MPSWRVSNLGISPTVLDTRHDRLADKIALVTGVPHVASGAGIATAFADEGATVWLTISTKRPDATSQSRSAPATGSTRTMSATRRSGRP